VWSSAVVVAEPSAERTPPLLAARECLPVGTLSQHRLDEPFGFPVRARSIRLRAQMLDAEPRDRGCVDRGAVAAAVVGHDALDDHAVFGEPGDRAFEEGDAGRALLVREDLEIRDSARVIDRDVHELPASTAIARISRGATSDTMARPFEPAQLLHVDRDQLAGMSPAVPVRWLRRLQARTALQTEPTQDRAHRGGRQVELGCDLRARPPQSSQPFDQRNCRIGRAVRDMARC